VALLAALIAPVAASFHLMGGGRRGSHVPRGVSLPVVGGCSRKVCSGYRDRGRMGPAHRPATVLERGRSSAGADWPRNRDHPWSRIADAVRARRCISGAGPPRAGVGRIRTMTPRVRAARSARWSAYKQRASRGTPRAWWVCVANRVEPGRRYSHELGVAREARRFTRWFAHGLPSCHRGKND
jgi:hypothetical protein